MTELEIKRYHVDSIAQFKTLRCIANEFVPEGIAELIEGGLRLTDVTSDVADFFFDERTSSLKIKE